MFVSHRGAACASLALCVACPAVAETAPDQIVVTAQMQQPSAQPGSHATIDATTVATTTNATNVEDALKYLPSLVVRKRHIGDTQSPLATRTSGVGASARSLIYADGILLSALIGNNNSTASPRWSLISPQEIARIDVLYGPYAAAYPGNSIGAVVSITTRMPSTLEATAYASSSVQSFSLYGHDMTAPARQIGGTAGDRFGPLSLFASVDHVASTGQPLGYATAVVPAAASATGTVATGSVPALNRLGQAIRILGASGIEHQVQDRLHVKAALDLTPAIRLTYSGALFLGNTHADVDSWLTDPASGSTLYAGSLNLLGGLYTVAASAFDANLYTHVERHCSHAATLDGGSGRLGWQIVASRYRYATDSLRSPTAALPDAFGGGSGTITRLDGTGWDTFDAKLHWHPGASHMISAGGHFDRFTLESDRYTTSDWIAGNAGALNLRSAGQTRTGALWIEDAWTPLSLLTFTIGGRQEWWQAYDGVNFSTAPVISASQPVLSASRFSPKTTAAWAFQPNWVARFSYGKAYRFPTVSELYQVVTTPVAAVPNPNLHPEHARSFEFAVEQKDSHGTVRLALFHERVKDALVSQLGPLNGTATLATFVQNVDRTRARGIELSAVRNDLLPGFDLSGSVTFVDGRTTRDAALPAAVGKQLPQLPRWKATAVATWRPAQKLAFTAAARYASHEYGTIDNSDPVSFTYQGFGSYVVVDLRAVVAVTPHWQLGLGVDNVNDNRYFLFHPFPGRTAHADVTFKL